MLTDTSLIGKAALVTGGGSGIGKAAAMRLARGGVKVGVLEYKLETAKKTVTEIIKKGGQAIALEADIANEFQLQEAVEVLVETYGRLDIVFANAGINGKLTAIEHMQANDWDKTMETNVRGTFLTVKQSIPHMKNHGGSIVITSSVNGNRIFSNVGMSAYSASKAAQLAFGKMAALELSKYQIRVNVICPGAITTAIENRTYKDREQLEEVAVPIEYPEGEFPLDGEPAEPEKAADLVYFLASEAASHLSGTEVYVDGAESLMK